MVGFFTFTRKDRLSKLKFLNFVKQKPEEAIISKWSNSVLWPATPLRYWLVLNSPFKYYGICIDPEHIGTKECLVSNQYRLLIQPKPFKIKKEKIAIPVED